MMIALANLVLKTLLGTCLCGFACLTSTLAHGQELRNSLAGADPLVLRFRSEPKTQSSIVRLGDLVEVVDSKGRSPNKDLLEIPLAPAPQVGASQRYSSSDILRRLELRGNGNATYRWSGAESTLLVRVAEPKTPSDETGMSPAFVQPRMVSQAEANLITATREYLWLKTDEQTEWRIALRVPHEHAVGLAVRRNIESINGLAEPWVGKHQLVFRYKYQGKSFHLELPVEISLPDMVVVAARTMRRDEVVSPEALTYAALPDRMSKQLGEFCTNMDDLIGKQLRRSMSTGQPIPVSAVGEPIVISSGEAIEVESLAGSVSVKTAGRALSGGAVGDLIQVEILSNRKRLSAVVIEPMKVRVSGTAHVTNGSVSTGNTGAGSVNTGNPTAATANFETPDQRSLANQRPTAGLSQPSVIRMPPASIPAPTPRDKLRNAHTIPTKKDRMR